MYCFKCGTKLEDGTSVCPACNQVQPLAQNAPLQYVFVKPKAPGKGCGIAGMVLGIVGLVYSFRSSRWLFLFSQGRLPFKRTSHPLSLCSLYFPSSRFWPSVWQARDAARAIKTGSAPPASLWGSSDWLYTSYPTSFF